MKAKGMSGPIHRSHIHLFLVPSKAPYTVISIIIYSLLERQMTWLSPVLFGRRTCAVWVVLSAVGLDYLPVFPHPDWIGSRHLQEDQMSVESAGYLKKELVGCGVWVRC